MGKMETFETIKATLFEIVERKHSTPTERELAKAVQEIAKHVENIEAQMREGPAGVRFEEAAMQGKGDASYTRG